MNARDKFLTLKIEPALRMLVKNGQLGLAYLGRRYNVGEDELRAWLGEFNSGVKTLTNERIDAVKRELGAISETHAHTPAHAKEEEIGLPPPPATPPTPVMRYAAIHAHKGITTEQPKPAILAKREPRPAQPPAPAAPAVKTPPAPAVAVAVKSATPWLEMKVFRVAAYDRWLPVLQDLQEPLRVAAKVCHKHNQSEKAFEQYARAWLGGVRQLTPERVREFLAWGTAKRAAMVANHSPVITRKDTHAAGTESGLTTQHNGAAPSEKSGAAPAAVVLPSQSTTTSVADHKAAVAAPGAAALFERGGELFKVEVIVRLVPLGAAS